MRFYPITYKVSPYLFTTTLMVLFFLVVPNFDFVAFGAVLLAYYITRACGETIHGFMLHWSAVIRYYVYALFSALLWFFGSPEAFVLIVPFILLELIMDRNKDYDYSRMQIYTVSWTLIIGTLIYFVDIGNSHKLMGYLIILTGYFLKVLIERYIDTIQSYYLITLPALLIIIPTYAIMPAICYFIIGFIPVTCEIHNHIKIPNLEYFDPDEEQS